MSDFLTWSHYVELLKIYDPLERSFYKKECEEERYQRMKCACGA
ncbi:MAG: hypothetical protein IKR85_04975 [Clostridia bacterium]|nr:hypothetical protein [Clostridia bacterium]